MMNTFQPHNLKHQLGIEIQEGFTTPQSHPQTSQQALTRLTNYHDCLRMALLYENWYPAFLILQPLLGLTRIELPEALKYNISIQESDILAPQPPPPTGEHNSYTRRENNTRPTNIQQNESTPDSNRGPQTGANALPIAQREIKRTQRPPLLPTPSDPFEIPTYQQLKQGAIPNIINMTTSDIDEHWNTLCNHITAGANLHIPTTRYKLIPALTMSTKTKNLLKIYNDRYTLYKYNMTNDKIQILANIKRHINSSKSEDLCSFWSRKMDELEELKLARDPRNFFRNIKNLMGKGNYNLGTHLKHNNTEIHDEKQQADLLAETWERIMTANTPKNSEEVLHNVGLVNNWNTQNTEHISPYTTINLNNLNKNHSLTKPITVTESALTLNRIKSKATGPSTISTEILKHTPLKTGLHITRLFNASLATGYFPKQFKQAQIYFILKPDKDPTCPSSYRPISLLMVLSKILEKIIAYRLRKFLEDSSQMNINQYGFRTKKSTEDIIFQTLFYLDTYIKLNKKTATASLDVQKAFDTVWHKGLIYKIYNHYNLPLITKKLLSHFIIERNYTVTHRNSQSYKFFSNAGVPQGSAISPTLFAMYTNDTPNPLNDKGQILLYADDITIITHHKDKWALRRELNNEITNIENYQSKWLIQSNKSKSNIVLYKQHIQHAHGQPAIRINGK